MDKFKIETLAQQFLESRIGLEGKGVIIVRAGENGCVVGTRALSPKWLPPFYESLPEAEPNANVVDPTGAGNAFLGAYAVGFLKTGNNVEAACYGAVGASFALEQVGIPKRKSEGDEELWNGTSVPSRLHAYTSKLGIAYKE
jgi:sugar/nucleoside kinase (ribokinase family)